MENKNIREKDIDIESTHIHIKSDLLQEDIIPLIKKQRSIISKTIRQIPDFSGYSPIPLLDNEEILYLMTNSALISDTGPMSSVAGSISEVCLNYLDDKGTSFTVIENGGDISLKTNKKTIISVFAGDSIFSNNIAFRLKAKPSKYGVCTSSGSVGHSKSFGITDATIVFSKQASIADALATGIGNYGIGDKKEDVVHNALEYAEDYKEYYDGVVVIKEDVLGKVGHIPKFLKTEDSTVSENYEIE